MVNVHFMTTKTEIGTPQFFYDILDKEFHFSLDVCASPHNAKCYRYITKEQNCFTRSWRGEICYMNPPYGRQIKSFIQKAYLEGCQAKTTVVCLVPSRTDTVWWHDYIMKAAEIRFIKGRLTFEGEMQPAPFPSALVVFRLHTTVVQFGTMGVR